MRKSQKIIALVIALTIVLGLYIILPSAANTAAYETPGPVPSAPPANNDPPGSSTHIDVEQSVRRERRLNGWQLRNGTWYFYINNRIQTGWLHDEDNNTWYYLDPDKGGAMATGWLTLGDYTYYFRARGAMSVGWRFLDGIWYYFCENGTMAADERITIDGKVYRFDASGACLNP